MASRPILVTGAAGTWGGGFKIVRNLREAGLPVRAMVRRMDDRAELLRRTGAEEHSSLCLPRPGRPG
jgi:nucleoside-diphosphate-sugar epimerase